ncbi:MAG TPA: PilN domain-containing protein [Tepidisphaeraceae bacterium]|jgi:Tfp pilus assembly protein PilN|nr:PilN domain-containing protein [Tepidisphaeraceae bacterium]
MIGRPTNFLGLAFSEGGIACVEVGAAGDRRTVRHAATFAFTPEVSLDKPEAAGQALTTFLREKRFTATRAVAGVPARWLMASEKDLPPANETQARAALMMQAERIGDSSEILFDFAGKPSSMSPTRVLLVGVMRQKFDHVQRLLDAAGLSVAAITSTGLALAGNLRQAGDDAGLLLLFASGAEMITREAGGARSLRHVPVSANGHGISAVGPLGAELRRAVATSGNSSGTTREILLLDGVGLAPDQITELSTRTGMQVRGGDELKMLGLTPDAMAVAQTSSEDRRPIGFFAPAISLAMAGSKPESLPVDFSHSRLAVEKKRRLGRNAILGICAGVALIAGIIFLYTQVSNRQRDLDEVNSQLQDIKSRQQSAQMIVDRVNYMKGYFDSRPPTLEALRELTQLLHDDDKLWVTTFSIHDNGKGSLAGKAADQNIVLQVVDRLKKNKKFSEVKLSDVHEADSRTHEWSFSLSFTFNFAE